LNVLAHDPQQIAVTIIIDSATPMLCGENMDSRLELSRRDSPFYIKRILRAILSRAGSETTFPFLTDLLLGRFS
jgi:acetolactate synthase regulatory subunit